MEHSKVLSVIDLLYEAAIEPQKWEPALAGVSQAVGAIGVSMVPLGPGSGIKAIVSESLSDANTAYQETWWRHDTPSVRLVTRGIRAGTVATDRLVMDEDEVRRDPFYQEFLRDYGIGQSLAAIASLGSGRLLSIASQRSLSKGLYQREEVETMTLLSPHIARALSIAAALIEARRDASDFADAVERLAWGVVMIDASGNVRHVNAVAQQFLGDGLSVSRGRIHAASRKDDARMQAAIKAALPSNGVPSSGVFIDRPSGRAPLYVEAAPVRPRLDPLEAMTLGAGGVMLLVRSLEAKASNISDQLKSMGLTPAQSRIAASVGKGESLRLVADAHGITYQTAQTHLRAIFSKLGIQRQAQLITLVNQLTAATGR